MAAATLSNPPRIERGTVTGSGPARRLAGTHLHISESSVDGLRVWADRHRPTDQWIRDTGLHCVGFATLHRMTDAILAAHAITPVPALAEPDRTGPRLRRVRAGLHQTPCGIYRADSSQRQWHGGPVERGWWLRFNDGPGHHGGCWATSLAACQRQIDVWAAHGFDMSLRDFYA